jgi:hypothetical protein
MVSGNTSKAACRSARRNHSRQFLATQVGDDLPQQRRRVDRLQELNRLVEAGFVQRMHAQIPT